MFMGYIEKLIMLIIVVTVISMFAVAVATYVFVIVVISSLISLGIYGYPWCHNGCLWITDTVADRIGIPNNRFALLAIGSLTTICLFVFGLVGAFFESLGVLQIPTDSLVSAVVSISLLLGVPLGLAVGLICPRPLVEVGRGPLARAIEALRERFASNRH